MKIILLVVGIIAVIVLSIFITNYYIKNPLEDTKVEVEAQLKDIQARFETLSAEIVSDDKKTLKPQYSEEQQKMFTAVLVKVSELDEFIESSKKNENLTESDYYNQLSEKVSQLSEIVIALDNSVHTNTDNFMEVFTKLSKKFDKLKEQVVSEDAKTLKDEYKQFQEDFDKLIKNIMSMSSEVDQKDRNQAYFDSFTEKGNDLIKEIDELAQKMNVSLEGA